MNKKIYVYSRDLKKVIVVKTQQEAKEILREGSPEYVADCPKCGCMFGINWDRRNKNE